MLLGECEGVVRAVAVTAMWQVECEAVVVQGGGGGDSAARLPLTSAQQQLLVQQQLVRRWDGFARREEGKGQVKSRLTRHVNVVRTEIVALHCDRDVNVHRHVPSELPVHLCRQQPPKQPP